MEFKAATCPNCQGQLQVPDNKDFVLCMYCGTNIKVREVISVGIQSNATNLIILAKRSLLSGKIQEAYNYYGRALEYEPNNEEAMKGKQACESLDKELKKAIRESWQDVEEEEEKRLDKENNATIAFIIIFTAIALIIAWVMSHK